MSDAWDEIAAREPVPGNTTLVRVFFRCRDALDITIDDWTELSLKLKEPISPERMQTLEGRAEYARAREIALKHLRFRSRTAAEVRRHLTAKGFPNAIVDDVIEHLLKIGLLDDQAYVERMTRQLAQTRSRRELAYRLKQLGVSADVYQPVLNDESTVKEELAAAVRLAEKFVRTKRGMDAVVVKRKLIMFLQRRGFGASVIRDVMGIIPPIASVSKGYGGDEPMDGFLTDDEG